jgi:hypothetical protein
VEDEQTSFLDQACAHGARALAGFESRPHHEQPEDYAPFQALFRNRRKGRIRVGRLFKSAKDFVDFDPDKGVSLLAPGLGDGSAVPAAKLGAATLEQIARRLLRKSIRSCGMGEAARNAGCPDVIRTYEGLCGRDTPALRAAGVCAFPLDKLPGRGEIDLLFTDGLVRTSKRWPAVTATEKVRRALVYGPVSAEDLKAVAQDRDICREVVRTLWKAVKTLKADEFDQWLTNVRAHGFLRLVGGDRLRGDKKKTASLQARRIYCALMWMAYEQMARCYGALMLQVYIDFSLHNEHEPTEEERWLFRQRHFPQLYLAGLPLDFLGKPQIRWIIRGLTSHWRNRVVEPERYDVFTELLGIFGVLAHDRREADRERKAGSARGRQVNAEALLLSAPAASADDDLTAG